MKFSLVVIHNIHTPDIIDGVWVQNHVGTLQTAAQKARDIEQANSYRIQVAVVEDLNYTEPNYSYRKGLRRLDKN